MRTDRARIGLQHLNAARDVIGMQDIVMGRPLEITPLGEVKRPVVVGRGPQILLISEVSEPRILCGEVPANRLCGIRRSVVRNDHFKVSEALTQNGLQAFPQITGTVVDGNTYTHDRPCLHFQSHGEDDLRAMATGAD